MVWNVERTNRYYFTKKYILVMIIILAAFILLWFFRSKLIIYEILAMVFCLLITFLTHRIKISNKILLFLGKYSFEIYILQRLPDIVLKNYLADYKYIYFCVSFVSTVVMAIVYKKITNAISKKLIKETK